MYKYICSVLVATFFLLSPVNAQEYAYFGFEPDIVTNYTVVKKKMGYVRLTVELMVPGDNLSVVEHHSPLLRDAIINSVN